MVSKRTPRRRTYPHSRRKKRNIPVEHSSFHLLPPQRYIILLDLDHTLIHSLPISCRVAESRGEKRIVLSQHGMCTYIRPFMKSFMQSLFKNFRVGVWTAGTTDYANQILPHLMTSSQRKQLVTFLSRDRNNMRSFVDPLRGSVVAAPHIQGTMGKSVYLLCQTEPFRHYIQPTKTLLIDDLQENRMLNPHNMIHAPMYYKTSRKQTPDRFLQQLRLWTQKLSTHFPQDIRSIPKPLFQ